MPTTKQFVLGMQQLKGALTIVVGRLSSSRHDDDDDGGGGSDDDPAASAGLVAVAAFVAFVAELVAELGALGGSFLQSWYACSISERQSLLLQRKDHRYGGDSVGVLQMQYSLRELKIGLSPR